MRSKTLLPFYLDYTYKKGEANDDSRSPLQVPFYRRYLVFSAPFPGRLCGPWCFWPSSTEKLKWNRVDYHVYFFRHSVNTADSILWSKSHMARIYANILGGIGPVDLLPYHQQPPSRREWLEGPYGRGGITWPTALCRRKRFYFVYLWQPRSGRRGQKNGKLEKKAPSGGVRPVEQNHLKKQAPVGVTSCNH